ncbi:MAG: adenosylmethionine--8-amino-7-oxononanoate transaminase [Sandaracinus sp.]|nr:adenosylmethionine--8-amino-7-oxononanoate transaminase [Sandaracinus sp.]MCB9613243.1 adenosylmethionine--8-amino-7-oxononanoate transaminase [Sandaracinus sp.]
MTDRDRVLTLDRAHVWRPFTSLERHAEGDDLVIAGAEGAFVIDADGRRYFDATGAWWCQVLGYAHPRLVGALKAQADALPHVALAAATHAPAAELAAKLVAAAPKGDRMLARVFYSDDGSTAVEVALKIAYQHAKQNGGEKRQRFLAFPGAYHGDTVGAMSVGAVDDFTAVFRPLLFRDRVRGGDGTSPRTGAEWEALCARFETHLRTEGDSVCALVVEPLVQGANGMRFFSPSILRRLREACDDAGVLLIADEVFTGFGRTGTMWACEHAGVVPDLLCTAKGLSGGLLPFAATLATDRVYEGFRGGMGRAFLHGHTFTGNPLGCAVALEVLRVFEDEHVLETLAPRAAQLREGFERLTRHAGVTNARGLGMVAAVDLGAGSYLSDERGWRVHREAKERGVLLRPLGDVIYAVPPLNVAEDELATFLDALDASLEAAT